MLNEVLLSSGLVTPKESFRRQDPSILQSPLLDSPRMKRIIAAYHETEEQRTFMDTIEAVTEVGNLVRHTLSFAPFSGGDLPPLEPRALGEKPVTNCYGFTVVASECLDRIGIEHYVAFTNEHAFITVFRPESDKAFMMSVADKELYLDMTDVIEGEHPLDQLVQGNLYAENAFYSERLVAKISDEELRARAMSMRPWLHFMTDHKFRYDRLKAADFVPVMRTYPSYPGRGILKLLFESKGVYDGDTETSYKAFMDMDGVYPEVDPRNNLRDVRLLLGRLEKAGEYQKMLDLASAIDSSLGASAHTRNAFFKPGVMKRVATRTNDLRLLDEADLLLAGLETGGRLREQKRAKIAYLRGIIAAKALETSQ